MFDVLITDDHPIVRQGLKQVLTQCMEINQVDEAADGAELFRKLKNKQYDVILLDISMPGRNGLEVLKDIKKEYPNVAVLILSSHSIEQYAVRSIQTGASGYLTKATITDELIKAVTKIAHGGKYITSELAEKLADIIDQDTGNKPHESLSEREYEVMILISEGKSIKDIAEKLILSPKTISTYRERILEKMKMKNTAEIIRYALKNGLVE